MISFSNARIPLGRDRRMLIENWALSSGEVWVIAGAGGTGKSQLARVIAGMPNNSGGLRQFDGLYRNPEDLRGSWISFDVEQEIRRRLRRDDDSEYLGRPDEGVSLEGFVGQAGINDFLHPQMRQKLKGRGIRHLSTGEFRQVLIAREAALNPRLAVLDEPFEGLDIRARPRLAEQLQIWTSPENLIVLTVNRREDIPSIATGMVLLKDDHLAAIGSVNDVLDSSLGKDVFPDGVNEGHIQKLYSIPAHLEESEELPEELISLREVSLAYNGKPVLHSVNWSVRKGEAWLLTGPNGSGKTSLLNLICGDEPRAFGQDVRVFGKRRGTGETVAEIKARIGMVSAAIQETVPRNATVDEVVGSGLRDSLVLDPPLDGYEAGIVKQWLELVGLRIGNTPFYRLPYGERRLAMIARAMIKHPPMLLLDEPMHGLDDSSRKRVSELVDRLIRETGTAVVFVSHRPDDAPSSVDNHIELVSADAMVSEAKIGRRIS